MTSADAIDQEILNDLRNGKKVEPNPELKPIVDAIVSASLAKAKEIMKRDGESIAEYLEEHPELIMKEVATFEKHTDLFKHNCKMCNHFRFDLDNKHNGLCMLGDFPVSWKDDDDDCPDFSNDWCSERTESLAKTIVNASKMLKEKKAGNPNFPYIVSEDVYKFLQEAEKKDSKV